MIELFTSEGCSSCPPADRWLSALRDDPRLWRDFVPVAFHVDYWDYIGWQDRFARPEFGDRQRRYAAEGNARFVYTPGIFLGGREWQGWRRATTPSKASSRVGDLRVLVEGDSAIIRFHAADAHHPRLTAQVAVLGMNRETEVRAGENSGRRLHHDFVALELVSVPLEETASGYEAVTALPVAGSRADPRADTRNDKVALAAWVSAAGSQIPIQSTGGFLR